MAFTSNVRHAGSDSSHGIELRVKQQNFRKRLYDRPGDDYDPHKGDLWKLSIRHFFGIDQCIRASDINHIKVLQWSNDGWNIESIVTFVIFDNNGWRLSSADLNVYRWIDGDDLPHHKEFKLNLVL